MAYRCVLFQRVSTSKQDTYRQNLQLINQYKADGYQDEEVYVIDYKESGVNLEYQKRQGMMELETVIEQHPIEIVYAHEISRVARREDVTFTLIQKLTERGINLHIQTPQIIRTLNDDGSENAIAKLVIAFLAYFAGEEAKQLKIRAKTGREAALAKGQIYSSSVKFGYKLENKKPVIDEADASIVRRIFEEYVTTDISTTELFKKYYYMGVLKKVKTDKVQCGAKYIASLLKDKTYCGQHRLYSYPAIVDEGMIAKAVEKMDNSKHAKRATNEIFLCRGLIKYDGYVLTPSSYRAAYAVNMYADVDDHKHKMNTVSVSANILDTIAYNEAISLYAIYTSNKSVQDKKWAEDRKRQLEAETEGYNSQIAKVNKEFERTINLYKRGIIEVDEVDTAKKLKEKQIAILEGKIASNAQEILTLKDGGETLYTDVLDQTYSNSDPEKIYEIVHSMIDRIELEKIANGEYGISIYPKMEQTYKQGDMGIEVTTEPTRYHLKANTRWLTLSYVHNGEKIPYDGEIMKIHKASRK